MSIQKQNPLPVRNNIEWLPNNHYFLTTSTRLHLPLFQDPAQKQIVLNQIKKLKTDYQIPIAAYSIQLNHFHLIFYARKSADVTKVKQQLHGAVSHQYKKIFTIKHKDIWQSTRTYFITDDDMYWSVQGYVIGNLLKHREVNNFQELYDDPYTSFQYVADKYGFDFACNIVKAVVAVEEDAEGIVKLEDFDECEVVRPKG